MQSEQLSRPPHIFLSFAPEDRAARDTLDKHLSGLQKAGIINDLHEQEIPPGSDWQEVVNEHFDQADIILLLITPNYIASNYCYGIQMKQALEKHEAGKARVIPIRFRPISWHHLPFAKLQGLPLGGDKAVSERKNRDRALTEVVEGIKRAIDDFAGQTTSPTKTSSPLWNVPYSRNRLFTGRDAQLHSLHATFFSERENLIHQQTLSGLGGIGKTQIALEYAYRYSNDYHAIFWLKGDTAEDLLTGFINLAPLLKLPKRQDADQQIVIAAIKRYLSHAPRWLIVIDNLDTFEALDDLIPVRGWGDILITTSKQATGTQATVNEIEKLTPDEGCLFLLRRAKLIAQNATFETLSPALIDSARTIYQRVDGHPLALDQAGAYIEETKTGLPRYISLHEKHEATLLKQRTKFATGHPASVATTLSLCMAQVKQHSPALLDLLSACAFLHPDAIPIELFNPNVLEPGSVLLPLISDELAFNAGLATLLDFSLLRRNSNTETINIHRLVQIILRNEMAEEMQRIWAERVVKALSRLFPESEVEEWQQCQQYLPHALIAADLIKQWNLSFPEAARLLYLAGSYLYEVASYADARNLCTLALTINKQVHGGENPETAQILHCLGNIYESQGNSTAAWQYYEQALTIGKRVWGPEHADTARLLNDIGEHFQAADQVAQADDYYRRALAIRQKLFDGDDPETASSLNNVAGICEEQGDYTQAETLYTKAFLLRERLRGPHHLDTAESLSNLARFYRVTGRYPQAQPLYEQAINAYEQAVGPEHPRTATCYNNFAVFCIALGQYTQAEQLLAQAIKVRMELYGPHHLNTIGSQNHLAKVYSRQGRYEQAKTLYDQLLSICEQKVGRQHPSTTAILINIGEFYLLQGNDNKAEAFLTEALANLTQGQEPASPGAASVLNLLGEMYLVRAQYEQAESLLTKALMIRQQTLGQTHPETAMTLKSLGDLAIARNDDEQAATLYQQALEIVLTSPGPSHPDVSELIDRQVSLLQRLGRTNDAQGLSARVRAISSPQEDNEAL